MSFTIYSFMTIIMYGQQSLKLRRQGVSGLSKPNAHFGSS